MSDRHQGDAEVAVIGIAAVVAAVGAVVWAGAQVAALAFGTHRPLNVGPGDAVAAGPTLVSRPSDPRAAWPEDAAVALPGAIPYWASTAAVAVAAVLLAAAVAAWWASSGGAGVTRRRRLGVDPEGRFARARDLMPLWISQATPGRMILGRGHPGGDRSPWPWSSRSSSWGRGRLVATENPAAGLDRSVPRLWRGVVRRRRGQRGSVLVIGPSQCGKTAALAVPAILEWAGPVIALSVKTDLMGATIARRRRLGQVRVFDPAGVTGEPGDVWSPLRESSTLAGARRAAHSISGATSWTQESGEMAFWTNAGEDLLAGLFWTAAAHGLGMDTVVGWVLTMERDTVRRLLSPLVDHAQRDIAAAAVQVREAFDGVWRSDSRQVSSIYLTARQMIRPWQEPTVQAAALATEGNGIDLEWLLTPPTGPTDSTDRTGPAQSSGAVAGNTLYVCADLDEAERLAPVLGGLVEDLLKQAYARAGAADAPLDPPLLVVIDEAGNWPMRTLPGRISTCAGLGIQLMLIFQSKAQIDAAYGRRADVVVSNAITKVFFAGLSDESTLRYASYLLGEEHVRSRSISHDLTGLAGPVTGIGRRSASDQPTRLELMPGSVLRRVRPGEALLVHGTLRPAHLRGRYWFLDPHLYRLATGQTATRRQLTRRSRRRIAGSTDHTDPTGHTDRAVPVDTTAGVRVRRG